MTYMSIMYFAHLLHYPPLLPSHWLPSSAQVYSLPSTSFHMQFEERLKKKNCHGVGWERDMETGKSGFESQCSYLLCVHHMSLHFSELSSFHRKIELIIILII